jgi:aminodeoxyfutalosine synthase
MKNVTASEESLAPLIKKICGGQRLNREDALQLLRSNELSEIGTLADQVRQEKVGDIVTFVGNYHICFTNICENSCKYCTFAVKSQDEEAFTLSLEEIEKEALESKKGSIPEILFLGGINPELSFDFFEAALERIRRQVPDIHILAFSPVEIDFFVKTTGLTLMDVLKKLKRAGLDAITGGGAELFGRDARERLGCSQKIDGARWLEIMETAHNLGVRSNASMLYGFGETLEERVDHLWEIRSLQDRTGGFTHFLPFAYSWENHRSTTGFDDLKMLAVSRLFLDNFDHIRAYWAHLGLKLAQISLSFGVDDLNGIKQKGRIVHSSGGTTPKQSSPEEMIGLIRDAGRTPAERDVLFNIIQTF